MTSADIVARSYCFAVTYLKLIQRRGGNAARLSMLTGVSGYRSPGDRKAIIRLAAVGSLRAGEVLCCLGSFAAQSVQFRALRLRAGVHGKCDQRNRCDNRHKLPRPRLVRPRARREDYAGRDAIASVLTHVKVRPLLRTAHAMRASLLASAMASTLWCSRFFAASIQDLSP
jgi:hypothetical protein